MGVFLYDSLLLEILEFLIFVVGVVVSLGWIVFVIWVMFCIMNWLMGKGMVFLFKFFEEVIN